MVVNLFYYVLDYYVIVYESKKNSSYIFYSFCKTGSKYLNAMTMTIQFTT